MEKIALKGVEHAGREQYATLIRDCVQMDVKST